MRERLSSHNPRKETSDSVWWESARKAFFHEATPHHSYEVQIALYTEWIISWILAAWQRRNTLLQSKKTITIGGEKRDVTPSLTPTLEIGTTFKTWVQKELTHLLSQQERAMGQGRGRGEQSASSPFDVQELTKVLLLNEPPEVRKLRWGIFHFLHHLAARGAEKDAQKSSQKIKTTILHGMIAKRSSGRRKYSQAEGGRAKDPFDIFPSYQARTSFEQALKRLTALCLQYGIHPATISSMVTNTPIRGERISAPHQPFPFPLSKDELEDLERFLVFCFGVAPEDPQVGRRLFRTLGGTIMAQQGIPQEKDLEKMRRLLTLTKDVLAHSARPPHHKGGFAERHPWLSVLTSLSLLLRSRGVSSLTEKEFNRLEEMVKWCQTTSPEQWRRLLASVAGMLARSAAITEKEWGHVRQLAAWCQQMWGTEWLVPFSAIAEACENHGAPNEVALKNVKDIFHWCRSTYPTKALSIFRALLGMYTHKGLPTTQEEWSNFWHAIEKIAQMDKHESVVRRGNALLAFARMQHRQGGPSGKSLDQFCCLVANLQEKAPHVWQEILVLLSSIQRSKGVFKEEEIRYVREMLTQMAQWSEKERERELLRILSALQRMLYQRGLPTPEEWQRFQRIVAWCKGWQEETAKMKKVGEAIEEDLREGEKNWIHLLSAIATMYHSQGIPQPQHWSCIQDLAEWCKGEEEEWIPLFSVVAGIYKGRGAPTRNEYKYIYAFIQVCKMEGREKGLQLFASFSQLLRGKGISQEQIDRLKAFAARCKEFTPHQWQRIASAIISMANTQGDLFSKRSWSVISDMIQWCQSLSSQSWVQLFSSIATLFHKKGIPRREAWQKKKEQIIPIINWCRSQLPDRWERLFASLASLYSRLDAPTNEEWQYIQRIAEWCKKEASDDWHLLFASLTALYAHQGPPPPEELAMFQQMVAWCKEKMWHNWLALLRSITSTRPAQGVPSEQEWNELQKKVLNRLDRSPYIQQRTSAPPPSSNLVSVREKGATGTHHEIAEQIESTLAQKLEPHQLRILRDILQKDPEICALYRDVCAAIAQKASFKRQPQLRLSSLTADWILRAWAVSSSRSIPLPHILKHRLTVLQRQLVKS